MDALVQANHPALAGLPVLALLPPGKSDDARVLLRMVRAAQKRWDWKIDALCIKSDRPAFEKVVAPNGRLFTRPGLLDQIAWGARGENAIASIDQRIAEAERAGRLPVGRIVAASASTIGRAFVVPVRRRLSSPMARLVLKDNTEPFHIFRRFFAFADDMLETSAPSVILSFDWVTPLHAAVWLAAARRGIPCLSVRRSKIVSDEFFWTADRLMFNTTSREAAFAKQESSASISDAAMAYMEKFRNQPNMVKYIQTKWQQAKRKKKWKFITRPISLGRKIAFDFLYPGRSRDSALRPTVFERLVSSKRRHTMARLQKRFFKTFDEAALEAMKYIYFPMHKETDLTLSFQATSWLDQRNTVSLLASCLPAGHKLLVREHRFNYGDRPSRYYREMSRLPNVVLIDAHDPQFKYIRHADLIITENGSSGWEGQLLGRRVINLASTFYDGTRGARKLEKIDQLGPTILEALANPAVQDQAKHDLALGRMIDAEMATTFPLPPDDDRMGLERLAVTLVPLLRRTSSSPGVVPHRPASAPRLAGHQVSQQN